MRRCKRHSSLPEGACQNVDQGGTVLTESIWVVQVAKAKMSTSLSKHWRVIKELTFSGDEISIDSHKVRLFQSDHIPHDDD